MHRIVVGSALAAGVGVAGMIGAGTASAGPGISYDGGPGYPIGIGDNSANGAQANASGDNRSIASYPGGGQNFVYSGPLATFPIVVPNTVVAVCGQRVAGSQDVFETPGNCLS